MQLRIGWLEHVAFLSVRTIRRYIGNYWLKAFEKHILVFQKQPTLWINLAKHQKWFQQTIHSFPLQRQPSIHHLIVLYAVTAVNNVSVGMTRPSEWIAVCEPLFHWRNLDLPSPYKSNDGLWELHMVIHQIQICTLELQGLIVYFLRI